MRDFGSRTPSGQELTTTFLVLRQNSAHVNESFGPLLAWSFFEGWREATLLLRLFLTLKASTGLV